MMRGLRALAAIAFALSATALPATPAAAGNSCGVYNECWTTFFTDTTYKVVTGYRRTFCDGSTELVGTVTGYRYVESWPCEAT